MDRSEAESISKKDYLNQKLLEKRKKSNQASRLQSENSKQPHKPEQVVIKTNTDQKSVYNDATVSILKVEPVTFASHDMTYSRALGKSFVSTVPKSNDGQLFSLNAHTWILILFTIVFVLTQFLTKRLGYTSKSDSAPNPPTNTVNEFGDAYDAVNVICKLRKKLESDANAHYLLSCILAEIHLRVDHREWIQTNEELDHLCIMIKDCASKICNQRRLLYVQARSLPKHLLYQRNSSFETQENMAEVESGMWSLLRAVAERRFDEHSQQHLLQLERLDISPPLLTTEMESVSNNNSNEQQFSQRQISIGQQQQEMRANAIQSIQRRESDCKNDLLRLRDLRFDVKRQLLERSMQLHLLNRAAFTISFAVFVLSSVAKLSECSHSKVIWEFGTCTMSNAAQRICSYLRSCDAVENMKDETEYISSASVIWDPMLSFTLPMLNYLQVYVSSYLGDSMGHTICAILVGIRVLPSLLITWFFNLIWCPAIGSYLSWFMLIVAFADVMQRVIVGPMWPMLIITGIHLVLYWIGHVIIDWEDWSISLLTIAYSVYTASLVMLPWAWDVASLWL